MSTNTTIVLKNVNTEVVCFLNTSVLNSQPMKLTYGERLRAARQNKGLTQDQLAEKSGVGQGTISKIERDGQGTSAADIRLSMVLDIHPIWLSEGVERYAPSWLGGKEVKDADIAKNYDKLRDVPIVGKAQLGDNGFWYDMEYPVGYGDGYIKFPTNDKSAYAVRCEGDSMRPRIKNGEFVIVEPHSTAKAGDEVLIKSSDGKVMVKIFLYERDDLFYFQSVNESHPSFSIPKEQIISIHYIAAIVKSSHWVKY